MSYYPEDDIRVRFCQRVACGKAQTIPSGGIAQPCLHCGGTYFDLHPPTHVSNLSTISEEDRIFLRVQRISPVGLEFLSGGLIWHKWPR